MINAVDKLSNIISPLQIGDKVHGIPFRVLPNIASPRLLLPVDNNTGLNLYRPFSLGGRVLKYLFKTKILKGDRLYLSRESISGLIADLNIKYSINEVELAIYVGTSGASRTLLCQVTDNNGFPILYSKMANTKLALARLRNEHHALLHLRQYKQIKEFIPEIHSYVQGNHHYEAMVLKANNLLPSMRGEKFTNAHKAFLSKLWCLTQVTQIFEQSHIWQEMIQFKQSVVISKVWAIRYDKAIHKIKKIFCDREIVLGLAHGDFAPWNIFVINERTLFVYDWEMTERECVPGYDVFHFYHVQHALLGKSIQNMYRDASNVIMSVWPEGCLYIKILELIYFVKASMFYLESSVNSPDTKENKLLNYYGAKLESIV